MPDVIQAEIEDILGDQNIIWGELKGSTALATGAKGLIGSALARALRAGNKRYGLNINIVAHTRQTHGDIRSEFPMEVPPDYISHKLLRNGE
ncbi:hypothetical protein [Desulfitobacterium hafniense]|nr:hypothetical protein [Desulfitobacterium hafniense]